MPYKSGNWNAAIDCLKAVNPVDWKLNSYKLINIIEIIILSL